MATFITQEIKKTFFFRTYIRLNIIILAMLFFAVFNYASTEKNDTNKLPISLFSNNFNVVVLVTLNPFSFKEIIEKGKIEATPKTEYEKNQKFWGCFFIIYILHYVVFLNMYISMNTIFVVMLFFASFNYASIEKNDTNKLPDSLFSNNFNVVAMATLNPFDFKEIIEKGEIEATPETEYEKNQNFWMFFTTIDIVLSIIFLLIWFVSVIYYGGRYKRI